PIYAGSSTERRSVSIVADRRLHISLPATRNLQDQWRTDSEILEERCNAGRNEGRAIHCTRSLATRHDPFKGRDHLDGTRSSVHFHNTSRSYAIQLRPKKVPEESRSQTALKKVLI